MLFDFFKKKKNFSDEEIEEEYQKAQKKVQKVETEYASLVRDIKKYAEDTCTPHEDDDFMDKKAEFMRIYTFRVSQWGRYHTSSYYKKGKFNTIPLWTQKWHDYEQNARLQAHKRWREIVSNSR